MYTRFEVLRYICSHTYACLTEDLLQHPEYKGFQTIAGASNEHLLSVLDSEDTSVSHLEAIQSLQYSTRCFGFFSYELRKLLESVHSGSLPLVDCPLAGFFEPQVYFQKADKEEKFLSAQKPNLSSVFDRFTANVGDFTPVISEIRPLQSKETYLDQVRKIKRMILEGEVYEVNLCMYFEADTRFFDPVRTYISLTKVSPMPYCAFLKWEDTYCLCASPELFLSHREGIMTSKPIKGTLSTASVQDQGEAKALLHSNEKECAENLMIVDLVRNDLNRCCKPGSVKVQELFGVYKFPGLYHMISTVEGMLDAHHTPISGLLKCFPMGSMTGAPKISAMNTIDSLEAAGRGLFSGSIGYMDSNGSFDFNVVIRSIFYNAQTQKIYFMAGSAITIDADPEQEYEECMLKAAKIISLLSNNG
jgi:para-aminobenzoate synthetase component 1